MSRGPVAVLVLEDGAVFRGTSFGATGERFGEVVFNTSMTGYQEILSDPSYCGQIVTMTAPHIGNTGVTSHDDEAAAPRCGGLVVREASSCVSSWRAQRDLGTWLAEHGVVAIEGVDTRALTRALRERGAQRGVISTQCCDGDALAARVRASPPMLGRELVSEVTCTARTAWDQPLWRAPDVAAAATGATAADARHVVAYDFGIKRSILRSLCSSGCKVTLVPATTSAAEAVAMNPDGFLLSNGPGDPAAVSGVVDTVRALVDSGRPVFGICLGHQILALALGARTYKLAFGHHGGNHPVKDLATGKVEITSQNHGFCVDLDPVAADVACTHVNLYDGTVEGFVVVGRPVLGVQYHPEASPGPHDAGHLFGRFVAAMRSAS